MPQYLCIDPGLSHTGIAISDSTHLVEPLTTIHEKNMGKILNQIQLIIKEQNPDHVIIGQPSFGPIRPLSQEIYNFIKPFFQGSIHLFSEDLSSKIALKKLIQSGGSKQARRHKQHSASAATILQNFLEL